MGDLNTLAINRPDRTGLLSPQALLLGLLTELSLLSEQSRHRYQVREKFKRWSAVGTKPFNALLIKFRNRG